MIPYMSLPGVETPDRNFASRTGFGTEALSHFGSQMKRGRTLPHPAPIVLIMSAGKTAPRYAATFSAFFGANRS